MGKRTYERLDVETFGAHLLESNDLDPVYVSLAHMVNEEEVSLEAIDRWLIAYWCFYHCGAASWIAEHEGDQFWWWMLRAAKNEDGWPTPHGGRWPRGSERRHFRGAQGIKAVEEMALRYPRPEDMVAHVSVPSACALPRPFADITKRVQEHRGFGPWIGFKVADMVDRVLGFPVNFDEAAVFMFKDPYKAALQVWRVQHGFEREGTEKPEQEHDAIHHVVEHLCQEYKDRLAPPLYDRPVGLQEVETVLCKWKSHMNGHYPLYNDIDEITEGLQEWLPHSRLAQLFDKNMPKRQ